MSGLSRCTSGDLPIYSDTFLGIGSGKSKGIDARVVLVPVPYDSTVSYKSGTRNGPRAIISASQQLENYDLELERNVSDVGIYTYQEIEPDVSGPLSMVERVETVTRSLLGNGRLIGILGGEHSVTTGAVKALRRSYPNLTVLYLDAHADLRDEYMGTPWGHASVARRLYDMCGIVEIGVRSLSAEERCFIEKANVPVVFWPPRKRDPGEVAAFALKHLSGEVYISVDLDVLDPSVMSAVGTPEPGGMTWDEVIGLIRTVAEHRKIVGFDITELSPGEGPEACAFTAAKLTYKLIGYATA